MIEHEESKRPEVIIRHTQNGVCDEQSVRNAIPLIYPCNSETDKRLRDYQAPNDEIRKAAAKRWKLEERGEGREVRGERSRWIPNLKGLLLPLYAQYLFF